AAGDCAGVVRVLIFSRLTGFRDGPTFALMRCSTTIAVMLGSILVIGCQQDRSTVDESGDTKLFTASSMRLHPIFTQVKDWTGDGKPDGIQAELEFQDQCGDPTKAAGKVIFELFDYRRDSPDPRGDRLVNPWIGSIATLDEQRARWNRTSRTYS